jgi:hypothetical protein
VLLVLFCSLKRSISVSLFIRLGCRGNRVLHLVADRDIRPSTVILDGRAIQSPPDSGSGRSTDYDGYKREKDSKTHATVYTFGYLPSLKVTAANQQKRSQLADLAAHVRNVTSEHVKRGIRERNPRKRQQPMGSDLSRSNSRKATAVSRCCLAGGDWRAPSRGHRVFGGWLALDGISHPHVQPLPSSKCMTLFKPRIDPLDIRMDF